MKKLIWLLILFMPSLQAVHLGTFGETFNIIEEDLLEVIQTKLKAIEKNGAIEHHQINIQQRTIEKIKRPDPVVGVVKTKNPRVFLYNPAVRVPRDLIDHNGQVFVKEGTIINPLAIYSLTKPMVFIDGDDQTAINWAIQQNPSNTKIILTSGTPFKLRELYKRAFYFDQNGTLVKKFGITQIPARVSQTGDKLQVEEILLNHEK